jgi:site-specific DNA-methyltransferase (adenine-specific)
MADAEAVEKNARQYIGGTDAARQWKGWGTALKPAMEPITVARKPLVGTVAANVLEHGTGAINVDGCRVQHGDDVDLTAVQRQQAEGTGVAVGKGFVGSIIGKEIPMYKPGGRWPANLIHDGSEEVVGLFPQTTSGKMKPTHTNAARSVYGQNAADGYTTMETYGDSGSAARFFYCAKASKRDRDEGNNHPTVKPTDLMRYLCRLVTAPNGTILDPFTGSGSTGKAAMLEGFQFIGIEREAEYVEIAKARIEAAKK